MEIKTKFNVEDPVFFITNDTQYINGGRPPMGLKFGGVFICEGVVKKIKFETNEKGEPEVIYGITVRGRSGDEWTDVHEDYCAPDIKQLGISVVTDYPVNPY